MDTPHKYRKGFRRDAEMLSEAYSGVYNEGQIDWKKATKDGKPAGQAYKDELKKKGHRKFKGPKGTTSATIPPGKEFKKDVDDLLARGYTEIGIEDEENNFKVGDEVYDDTNEHGRIVNIRGDEVDLQSISGREEGWTVNISDISFDPDHGLSDRGPDLEWRNTRYPWQENEEGELSDDWMKQDYESRQEERGGDHAKGVKMAIEALGMFKDELHIDGHSEDINVNELADAHDQLSRALHWILDETDVEYITGGRATQKAEADSQPEQFTPMEFPSDEY